VNGTCGKMVIAATVDRGFTVNLNDLHLHMWTGIKSSSRNIFIVFRQKEIYCILYTVYYMFKTCCIISVLFSAECCLFHDIFFWWNNTFLINPVLKFKHQPSHWRLINTHSSFVYTEQVVTICVFRLPPQRRCSE
jgi:hypothetical protein